MKIASVIGVGRYKRKFSYECKNRIHFDRRIICRSILALVLVSSILLSPASSQYTAFNWDKAFSKPQYLLHSTSWTEIMDSGSVLGPYQDDTWFLYTNKPEGGKIDIPKQGGKTTYSIDEISGPWTTPREVCQAANLMKTPSKNLWSYDLTATTETNALEGKDRDATALNLLPYLEDDNKTTRMMAIIGLRLLYPKAKLDGLPEDVREAVKRSINSKDAGLWMWTAE